MTATATPRRAMRDRVKIGQQWRRNRGGEIGVIRQIHRADRQVELLGVQGVRLVNFTDLRTKWTEVETVGPNQPTMPAAPSVTASAARDAATPPFTSTESAAGTHFKPARTVPCRCRLTGDTDCRHCHGTGHRLNHIDFEKNTGQSDLVAYTQGDPDVPLPTTKRTRDGLDPRDARILLVAPPKTGKTTLAAAWAPDTTLLLDTHQGTRLLNGEHYVQPIATFADFEAAVTELAAGKHKFRTVVIDLAEDIYKYAEKTAAQTYGKVAAGVVEYGKGTTHAEAIFRNAVDTLLATSLGVWFISHVETIQDGPQVTYVPKIDKKVRTYVEGACDFCLLAEADGPNRKLRTAPSKRYQVGSRVVLPDPMNLDPRDLYVEIAKGLAKPKPPTTPQPAVAAVPTNTTSEEPVAA